MSKEELRSVDLHTIDPNSLVDIRKIKIEESAPKEQRIESYLKQVKNPYCFKVGKVVVKVSFTEGGGTFQEHLETALKAM